jgi:SpoVK/Ycf46/Vps4 family AAA+-type ATPase
MSIACWDTLFVDLHTRSEREEIFRIHLSRRNRRPESFDLRALAAACPGFSQSEVEQAIVSAPCDAFAEKLELEQRHVEGALRETYPLATTMSREIDALLKWARQRTRMASTRGGEGS